MNAMNDIALEAPTSPAASGAHPPVKKGTRSLLLGALAVVVLGGATTALFALEACAENSPAQPIPATAPNPTTSGSAKPPATPPVPSPTPPLPPPPT
jgi:hypothetical protein